MRCPLPPSGASDAALIQAFHGQLPPNGKAAQELASAEARAPWASVELTGALLTRPGELPQGIEL